MAFISFEDFLKLSIDEINLLKPVEIFGFSGNRIPDIYNASEAEKDAAIETFVNLILQSNITKIALKDFYPFINRNSDSLFTPIRMNKIFDALEKSRSLKKISLEIGADSLKSSFQEFCNMLQKSEHLREVDLIAKSFQGQYDNISFFEYLGNDNCNIFIKSFEKIEALKLEIGFFNKTWTLSNEQSVTFGKSLKNCKKLDLSNNSFFLHKSNEIFENLMAMLEQAPSLKNFDILEYNYINNLTDEQFSRLASIWREKNKECEKLFIPNHVYNNFFPQKLQILFKAFTSLSPKFFMFEFPSGNPATIFQALGVYLGGSPNLRSIELKGSPLFSEENFSSFISEINKSKTIFEIKLSAYILKQLTKQQQEELLAICKRNRNEYELSVMRGSLELLQETPDTERILPLEIRLAILHMAFPDYPEDRLKSMTEEGENFNKALVLREERLSSNNGDDNNSNSNSNSNNNNNSKK